MGRPPIPSGFICYHCGSSATCKAGVGKHGKQRFYCRACRRWFIENPEIRTGKKKRRKKSDLPSTQYLIAELKEIASELGRTPTTHDWAGTKSLEAAKGVQSEALV